MKRYHVIKKLLVLCILISMILATFAGCAKEEEQNPAGTISDFESQTHFQPGASGDDSASGDSSKAPVSGEFVVSDKKYDYKDANLVLLYVENQTNRHYNVTINGKYLDKNGEILKEETQTFEAFPAGWSNHFMFYPKFAFDRFTFELETEECTGESMAIDANGNPLASYIELAYERSLIWTRGVSVEGDEARDLTFYMEVANHHPSVKIGVEFHVLVLDTNGNIYLTDYDHVDGAISGTAVDPVGGPMDGKFRNQVTLLQQAAGGDETIPDNVQGVFTAIFAIANVLDFDRIME